MLHRMQKKRTKNGQIKIDTEIDIPLSPLDLIAHILRSFLSSLVKETDLDVMDLFLDATSEPHCVLQIFFFFFVI